MKFSKKLLLAAICAASALGNVSAMPANVTEFLNARCESTNRFYVDSMETANRHIATFKSGVFNMGQFVGSVGYDCIIRAKDVTSVATDVKVACIMKALENSLIPTVKEALMSNKVDSSDSKVRDVIIKNGFVGNGIRGQLLSLCGSDEALKALVSDWAYFYAVRFQGILDMTPADRAEAYSKLGAGEFPKTVPAWFTNACEAVVAPGFDLAKAQGLAKAALAAKLQDKDGVTAEHAKILEGSVNSKLTKTFVGWISYIANQIKDKSQLNALRVSSGTKEGRFVIALLVQLGMDPETEIK